MKVGIVTEYYFPYLGGIAEHVHYTYKYFKKHDVDARIITPTMRGLRYRAEASGAWAPEGDIIRIGESHPFYINGGFVRFTSPFGLTRRLRKVFAREKFDLIHVHAPMVPVLPVAAVMSADCPVVGTFHTVFRKSFVYSLLRPYFRKVLGRIDGCLSVSPFSARAIQKYFDAEFTVIPNGVDTDVYKPDNEPVMEFRKDNVKNILFFGRFDPHNGLPTLLEAFGRIKSARRDTRLIIVGDGPLADVYRKSVPASLASSVVFAGIQHALKPNFYATADVFCHPASLHNLSLVCLEAMATGIPIVASDIPSFRWLMQEDAVYFPPQDSGKLAESILGVLGNDGMALSLGERARRRALRYSWDSVTARIISYFQHVLFSRLPAAAVEQEMPLAARIERGLPLQGLGSIDQGISLQR